MKDSNYIIRLNPVDWLTISGVLTSSLAAAAVLQHHFLLATALLYLAMLGDALDGMLARKWGLERNFGRYLDGFMDVLIYLVTPALLLYAQGFDGLWSIFLLMMLGAGCVRLAVFNDIGNIKEGDGLAYLGMPVFWSLFILAAYLIIEVICGQALPRVWLNAGLALALAAFSHAMVWRRPFFKFKKLWHILTITLGGAALFFALHLLGVAHA